MFDKRGEKVENFQVGDWVLKWDAVGQDKGKHENLTLFGLALLL